MWAPPDRGERRVRKHQGLDSTPIRLRWRAMDFIGNLQMQKVLNGIFESSCVSNSMGIRGNWPLLIGHDLQTEVLLCVDPTDLCIPWQQMECEYEHDGL